MVAHLLRLKLTLLRNSVRRSPWQLVGLGIGALYALGIVGLGVAGLLFLRQADIALAQTVVVLGGAAALLGWAIIPVAASAADMTLDPARFTTSAVPMPQLLAGLALGGLIGIPGVATSLVALATVGTWSRSIPAAAGALVGAALGVLSCVLVSKVVTTATAGLAASRRFKDVSAIVFLIPLVLMGPIVAGIARGIAESGDFLTGLARALAWTPAGAAWSLGGELAAGDYGAAALKFAIALATLAGLALCWMALLRRALVTPPFEGSAKKRTGGLGLFALFPATPTGAVAAP
jgi:ABC-2 type transport system permease protein